MTKRNYKLYIEDILESILKIEEYTRGMAFKDFSKDSKTVDAVIRNFEIIGEAAKQLPKSIKDSFYEIEWCISSKGFGQMWHKTKRGFLLIYTAFQVFKQASKNSSASFVTVRSFS